MATQLFLRSVASDLAGAGQQSLSSVRGTASTTAITTTTASGTNIQVTATAGGQALTWFSGQIAEAITISGTVTVNIRGLEAANTVNAGRGILIERTNSAGTVQSSIVADTTVPTVIAEYSTADAANGAATYTPTSTAMSVGDRIKVTLKVRNVGTMAANASGVTNSYNGPTAAAAGDTYVTFTENFRTGEPVEYNMNFTGRGGYG